MSDRFSKWFIPFVLLAVGAAMSASAETKLLRFPDVHGDRVVFCYAGDLWAAPLHGGTASRLTAHDGLEIFPKFSPDGQWIAFTGQYDGDEQVYVIPSSGGIPRQLTFYPAHGPLPQRWGYDHQVYGWSRDGKSVLFRSTEGGFSIADTRLFLVSLDGGLPVPLPMPVSGAGDFSPDAKKIVYSPLFRDFRSEKRYQGGWANDLYTFDLTTYETVQITDDPRTDRDPMWIGDRIYFSSDRTGTFNLYSYDPSSKKTGQLTRNTLWDLRWPSSDEEGRIVYEQAGELALFDTKTGSVTPIPIVVPDDGLQMRPSRISVDRNIEDYSLSPKGERALFVARGDVFTAPIEKGPTRNLTNSSSAHDKWARWSPDGTRIAFMSDRSGEEELYVVGQDGAGGPTALTAGGKAFRYAPEWSPDGKKIAFGDKDGKIFVVTVASKQMKEIADEKRGQSLDYSWSPDSAFLAYSLTDSNDTRSLHIWSSADDKDRRVNDEWFSEHDPVWDPDGNTLYYESEREFAPQVSTTEWNFATTRQTGVFALTLKKDGKSPFPPESDEVKSDDDSKDKDKKDEGDSGKDGDKDSKEKKDKKKVVVQIDWDGLASRVTRVPLDFENYEGLAAIKGALLYVRGTPFFYGRDAETKSSLRIFTFKDRKEDTIAEDVSGFAVSSDGSKVLVKQDKDYVLYDAKAKSKESKKVVSTKGLMADRIPSEEWTEVFDEVWRRFRDFFYVPNMHGYDWIALRDQYRPLLKHVAHRADLNYVISEMISELSISHAYISGGDFGIPPRPKVALPGARFGLDKKSGRYRIDEIYKGENEEDRYRSPLTEVGVDVRAGDYVLAVDGEELRYPDNPYRMLRNKADRPVELTVNGKPESSGSRKARYQPITSESELRYLAWVTHNREAVEKMSGGKLGYLHIPDMGADGIREFIKWFYPQIRKDGLVIDDRGNGGGNVSQMIIERLRRKLLGVRYSRTSDDYGTYPSEVFDGHLVCLLNEDSASDGDIFPARFRDAGLGPLIGKRSWGGVIGITNHGSLIDGGTVNVPEFGTNGPGGEWIIEGHGVDPDIVVENDPKSLIEGQDRQLERGVAELMKKIAESPKKRPTRPKDPIKTK